LDRKGRLHQLVLRRWARSGWELADPDFTAAREARILELLVETLIPAPKLLAADPAGTDCDVPALLLTRIPGHPPGRPRDMDSFLQQLASALPLIHSVGGRAQAVVPGYRRYHEPEGLALPAWLPPSRVWERAFDVVRSPAPSGPSCFIHRDYHSGNTLWSHGLMTGVVDWTQASWGPPSVDLGHMRWNLAAEHGADVADRFLDVYRRQTTGVFHHDPYWDVVTLVDLLADVNPNSPLPKADVLRLERYLAAILGDRPQV
jgi:aminoglycoside phosphotransferase (APT) family kinase protein